MPDPVFLAGETLPAGKLQALGNDGLWTPVLTASTTNPTLGSGSSQTGSWHRNGRMIFFQFLIVFGTSGVAAGSGTYRISVPFPIDPDWQGGGMPLGDSFLTDDSATAFRIRTLRTTSAVPDIVQMSDQTGGNVNNTTPWTWAANDTIRGTGAYLTEL